MTSTAAPSWIEIWLAGALLQACAPSLPAELRELDVRSLSLELPAEPLPSVFELGDAAVELGNAMVQPDLDDTRCGAARAAWVVTSDSSVMEAGRRRAPRKVRCTTRIDPVDCASRLMSCDQQGSARYRLAYRADEAMGLLDAGGSRYVVRAKNEADAWVAKLWRVGDGVTPKGPPLAASVLREGIVTLLIDRRTADRGAVLFALATLTRAIVNEQQVLRRGRR